MSSAASAMQETAADLPVLLAVLSSLRDAPLAPDKTVAFGEVGLSGEIRPVPNGEERLKEAATHGFKRDRAEGERAETCRFGAGRIQGHGGDRGRTPRRGARRRVKPAMAHRDPHLT